MLQIVYILDQVRALEKEMRKRIKEQGLHDIVPQILVVTRLIPESQGTSCNQPLELIEGTTNAHILRVPFRQKNGDVLQQWISRYVRDSCRERSLLISSNASETYVNRITQAQKLLQMIQMLLVTALPEIRLQQSVHDIALASVSKSLEALAHLSHAADQM